MALVGERRGVGADWLNDGAKGIAPRLPAGSEPVFTGSRLRVYSPSAEYILAMKLVSGRADDMGDIRFLIGETGLVTPGRAAAVGGERVPASADSGICPVPDRADSAPASLTSRHPRPGVLVGSHTLDG